ncbi:ArnT family glycosyltransferase [Kitasatospora sp. NPDC052896]|uniref:ArnT family glycosyltransferase n=1 Tax=Kitasatospora sp. NPDC052896 TaxID=3364061 RepID=UPI0037C8411D
MLLAITAVAGLLYFWNINQSGYHTFYSDAVRSMTESWKAFVYGSFDPANSITLDKLPGFLWPQAISARIFGFHPWALTLPQAIEGVLSVLALYRVVQRWAGANAALIAAAAFTLTPVLAGLFRTAVEDPAFTLMVILAAEAAQRAAQTARLRPLLMAGVWVGIGFQAKMLEAWAVLPALAAIYLVSTPIALRKRIVHVLLAGLVTVAVSASWILLVTVTPAKDRPYVDGTTDNSAFSMVVGYNFLNRFSSVGLTASSTGSVTSGSGGNIMGHAFGGAKGAAGGAGGAGGGAQAAGGQGGQAGPGSWGGFGGGAAGGTSAGGTSAGGTDTGGTDAQGGHRAGFGSGDAGFHGSGAGSAAMAGHRTGGAKGETAGGGAGGGAQKGGGMGGNDGGWTKMFSSEFAPQTGWLYPLAAISVICGLLWRRREPRTDHLRAGFLLWGTWLAVFFLVFSAGSVGGHSYYMGVIGAPLAALSGAGTVLLWRGFREGGARAWALPVALVGTVAWAAYLTQDYPTFLPWLMPTTIGLGVVALVLLLVSRGGRFSAGRLGVVGLLTALVAMLVAPGAWAASVLDSKYGNSGMGTVGPSGRGGGGGGHGMAQFLADAKAGGAGGGQAWPGAAAFGGGAFGGGAAGGAGKGGSAAMAAMAGAWGGGSGDAKLTSAQQSIFDYVSTHAAGDKYLMATTSWSTASPYIMATGKEVLPMGGFTGQVPNPTLDQLKGMVADHQLQYILTPGAGESGRGGFGGGSGPAGLTQWLQTSCSPVPASEYGAAASSAAAQVLYHCTN